uniref:Uncharacterized protein n=1 Tax=Cacopsylla melanoneura TaxID=428564 RepID=A0A8D9E256_9HEMI
MDESRRIKVFSRIVYHEFLTWNQSKFLPALSFRRVLDIYENWGCQFEICNIYKIQGVPRPCLPEHRDVHQQYQFDHRYVRTLFEDFISLRFSFAPPIFNTIRDYFSSLALPYNNIDDETEYSNVIHTLLNEHAIPVFTVTYVVHLFASNMDETHGIAYARYSQMLVDYIDYTFGRGIFKKVADAIAALEHFYRAASGLHSNKFNQYCEWSPEREFVVEPSIRIDEQSSVEDRRNTLMDIDQFEKRLSEETGKEMWTCYRTPVLADPEGPPRRDDADFQKELDRLEVANVIFAPTNSGQTEFIASLGMCLCKLGTVVCHGECQKRQGGYSTVEPPNYLIRSTDDLFSPDISHDQIKSPWILTDRAELVSRAQGKTIAIVPEKYEFYKRSRLAGQQPTASSYETLLLHCSKSKLLVRTKLTVPRVIPTRCAKRFSRYFDKDTGEYVYDSEEISRLIAKKNREYNYSLLLHVD